MWLLGCLGLPRPSEAEAYDGFGELGISWSLRLLYVCGVVSGSDGACLGCNPFVCVDCSVV